MNMSEYQSKVLYHHNCDKKNKKKVISFLTSMVLSTDSSLAIWLFLIKKFLIKKMCMVPNVLL